MKNFNQKFLATVALVFVVVFSSFAQEGKAKTIKLNQVEGAFTKTELTLKSGKDYVFEITNDGVDHEVGFVIAELKDNGEAGEHVKTSYLSKTIKDGETGSSKVVNLAPGTYGYFCPLNPTPVYTITVK